MYHLVPTLIIAFLGTLFSLLSHEQICKSFYIEKFVLDYRASIWFIFILDLGIMSYLIYSSGGLSSSPFVSYLILVPTVGLFLGLAPFIISINYLCATIIGVILLTQFSDLKLTRSAHYSWAVGIIFVSTMAVALAGNFIRRKWSPKKDVQKNFSDKSLFMGPTYKKKYAEEKEPID